VKGEYNWIKNILKRIVLLFVGLVILQGIILIFFFQIVKMWIGNIDISFTTAFWVAFMVLLNIWISIFDFITNSISKIKLQMFVNILAALINIPISYYFAVFLNFGVIGVIWGSILSIILSAFTSPYQAYLIINNKESGIWSK
jgi:Na+-driven multidrug efflux pump